MNKRKVEQDTEDTLNIEPLKQTKKVYPCTVDNCEFETTKAPEMLAHRATHYPNSFLCGIEKCESKFESQALLKKHLKTHKSKNNKFECDYKNCTHTTKYSKEMQLHTITHSVDVTYLCGIINCQETFVSKQMLEQHREIHKIDGKYVCGVGDCKYSTERATSFQNHQIGHLKTKPFKCEDCVETFTTQYNLDRHGLTYSGARAFVCQVEVCRKAFRDAWSLDQHTFKIHSDFEGFECPQNGCDKKFRTKYSITQHIIETHCEEKPILECEECLNTFSRKESLLQHIRDHHSNEPKRFTCDHCSYKTNYLQAITRHIEIHERRKNYTFVLRYARWWYSKMLFRIYTMHHKMQDSIGFRISH
jgi:KRAB domain-containing zinc finger protein